MLMRITQTAETGSEGLKNHGCAQEQPLPARHGISLKESVGGWIVVAFQPYFETGFPHGVHQSISAAATSWATMALILGSSPPAGKVESRADAR